MSTYLPGTTGERIGDLLNKARASGLTKTKLAEQVGVSPSTITRIVNGDTQTVNDVLLGLAKADPSKAEAAGRAMQEVEAQKLPVQSLDIERIKSAFAEVLEELKGETTSRAGKDAALTRETMDKMMKELTKGDLSVLPSVTPEQIAGAVMKAVDLTGYPPEKVEALRGGLNAFFSGDMRMPEVTEGDGQTK